MDTCIKQEYLPPVVLQVVVKMVHGRRKERQIRMYIKWMDACTKQEYLPPVVLQVVVKKVSSRRETYMYVHKVDGHIN